MSYIEKTMITLKTLENSWIYPLDPIGHTLNLMKKTFTKETFELVNRNFNFTPTCKVYNKHKLNEELVSFYRLIKLKANLKITKTTN